MPMTPEEARTAARERLMLAINDANFSEEEVDRRLDLTLRLAHAEGAQDNCGCAKPCAHTAFTDAIIAEVEKL